MSLAEPWWLLALLPVAALLLARWWQRRRRPAAALVLVLQTGLSLCLILALAGLRLTQPGESVLIVILDGSASLGPASWPAQQAILAQLQNELPASSRRAVVLVGAEARVLSPLQAGPTPIPAAPPQWSDDTDLAAAVLLAASLVPQSASGRVLLVGDGRASRGQLLQSLALLPENVQLHAIALGGEVGAGAAIEDLRAESQRLRLGETLRLNLRLRSQIEGLAQLRLYEDDLLVSERELQLQAGETRELIFERRPSSPGIIRYRASLQVPQAHARPSTDAASTWVEVRGLPMLLYLTTDPEHALPLRQAMAAEGVRIDIRSPEAMPEDLAGLLAYDGIVCSDVPASDLGDARLRRIRSYVEDLGGGLVMIGGPQSFGVGGYQASALATALPVAMQATDREDRAPRLLMLVLDRSSSMSGQKMELCKQAAIATGRLLQAKDHLGVVAFDSQAHWIVPTAPLQASSLAAIAALEANGGTDIYAGMSLASSGMQLSGASARHMIVLSDGQGSSHDPVAVVRDLVRSGITVSTVAVGNDCDLRLLQQMARTGQGVCYANAAAEDLQAIFAQDAMRHLDQQIAQGDFVPVQTEPHPLLADFDARSVPPLQGFVRTEARPGAQVPLVTGSGEPLLAHWRFGLGRVTAFTSGAGSRWASLWIAGWPGYGAFWSQVLRQTMRPPQGQLIDVHARALGGQQAEAVVDLRTGSQDFANQASVHIRVARLPPQGSGNFQEILQAPAQLVAPGRYRLAFELLEAGSYLIQARAGARLATTGLHHRPPSETSQNSIDHQLLRQITSQTGGRLLEAGDPLPAAGPAPPQARSLVPALLLAALGLLIITTLLRRRWT